MAHLVWFFAGTSFGIILGALLTSLTAISDPARREIAPEPRVQRSARVLTMVRR